MGIGEAAVTLLSENGVPTPVVHTKMTPPASRMGPADDIEATAKASPLWAKYGQRVDNESAREMLAARMAPPAAAAGAPPPPPAGDAGATPTAPQGPSAPQVQAEPADVAAAGGAMATVSAFLKSKEGKRLEKQVVRGVFGLLKKNL
jgi:hypothetical protein